MSCDWAERVSALVDGELAAGEARAVEDHIGVCAACRDAAQSFLALRREIVSHVPAADPSTQSRVLSAVLSSKNGRARARETRARRGLLAGLFDGRGLAPAMSTAAALLLVAAALGLLVYLNSRRNTTNVNLTARDAAPAAQQSSPQPEASPTTVDERRRESVAGIVGERPEPRREVTAGRKMPRRVVVAREPRRRAIDAATPDEVAEHARPEENNQPGAQPSAGAVESSSTNAVAAAAPNAAAAPRREAGSAGALDAARHAEQAQMLLRSFRNARLADGGIAYERARSKKLLYRNIVLRREAATRRDAAVAQALDRLEPILLDIANLPDDPAEEEVNSIRERMRKKNLVVMLQASAVARKRPY